MVGGRVNRRVSLGQNLPLAGEPFAPTPALPKAAAASLSRPE